MIVVLVLLMLQLSNNNLSCVADFVQFRDSLHTSFTDTLKNRQHSTKETRTVTKSTLKTLTSAYSNLSSSESEYISHTYWNLSCPYEWSKYSCVHQGNSDRAIEALQFVMSHSNNSDDGNRITLRAIEEKFKSTRVLLLGDSLTRQLFISLACRYFKDVLQDRIPWAKDWPCHGVANCHKHGQHSGFEHAAILWKQGGELHFNNFVGHQVDLYKRDQLYYHSIRELNAWVESNAKSNLTNTYGVRFHPISKSSEQTLTKKDVIALNLGIHTKMGLAKDGYPGQHQLYRKIAAYGQKLTKTPNAPKFVYIVTPAQHFASFDGVYTEQSNKFCIYSINSDPRATMEREIFEVGSNCDAVLDAVNMTSLGNLHVGVSATMTDCSHYCQPGVPDISAGRLVRIVGELIGTNHNSTVN